MNPKIGRESKSESSSSTFNTIVLKLHGPISSSLLIHHLISHYFMLITKRTG